MVRDSRTSKGKVILLHGLGCNSWFMSLLASRLTAHGYAVESWGYWSLWQSLETLIPEFEERFRKHEETLEEQTRVHIVGHSLGSIIARAVLTRTSLPSVERMVMLSPPNRGSHAARRLGPFLRWLSPLVEELSDQSDSLVNRLARRPLSRVEVGVVAAEWDDLLDERSTHLDCESDHIILPSRHGDLVFRRPVAEQVVHFLDHGQFHREECRSCQPVPLASESLGT